MSIHLEGYNIILPITIIDSVYPGGSKALIDEIHISNEYVDDDILRIGAEDTLDIARIIEEWTARGLRDIRKRKGKRAWIDLCLVEATEGPTLPCKWISVIDGKAEYIGKKQV